jgi:hypothetical protein
MSLSTEIIMSGMMEDQILKVDVHFFPTIGLVFLEDQHGHGLNHVNNITCINFFHNSKHFFDYSIFMGLKLHVTSDQMGFNNQLLQVLL